MAKINIKVYSKLNDIEEITEFMAIKMDDVIKYIDLENNKMIIDMKNNIIIRENSDYVFTLKFNENIIEILIKKVKKVMNKEIKVLLIDKTKKRFLVRYLLSDEKLINEYYVNY